MKVAVCISGHLRTYEHCAESLRRYIIDPLKADVYLDVADRLDYRDAQLLGKHAGKALELYKPVAAIFDSDVIFVYQGNVSWRRGLIIDNFFQMWHRIQRVIQLSEQSGIKYDVVIRCRPDHRFNAPLPAYALNDSMKLWLPTIGHWAGGLNDQFAFGSCETMRRYGSLLTYFDAYARAKLASEWSPEMMAAEHFRHVGVEFDLLEVDMDLIRHNGHAVSHESSRICTYSSKLSAPPALSLAELHRSPRVIGPRNRNLDIFNQNKASYQ